MTDSLRLATLSLRVLQANTLVSKSANSGANTGLYIFYGVSNPYPGSDANVPSPTDARQQLVSLYDWMVGGRVVGVGGSKLMAARYAWDGNTVFTPWSDTDSKIFSRNFFAVVNAVSQYHVFKCLDNGGGVVSTSPPTFSDTSASDTHYETGDGYVWKYLYSIDRGTWDSFATLSFIPVLSNANVSGNAVVGALDIISVSSGGALYNNYFDGQWNSSDIQVGGNPLLFAIGNTASAVNGFYTNCILSIIEGVGKGQYRSIVSSQALGTAKEVVVNSAFTTVPDTSSVYSISPEVLISSLDGRQTSNCVARALINAASSNGVWRVEILARGVGYRGASASVRTNPYVPVVNVAVLTPVMPPPGGHGGDIPLELGATSVGFSVTLSNTEANTISSDNDFRQVGILLDPLWSNVSVTITNSGNTSGSNGTFLVGEEVKQVTPTSVSGNISVNTTSAVVTGTGTDFGNVFVGGSLVLVQGGASFFYSNVSSVTNSTSLVLGSNCSFVNGACKISLLNQTANGVCLSVGSGVIRLGNVGGVITSNVGSGLLLGVNSVAVGYVNVVSINGVTKSFSTFNQRTVYQGSLTSGVFVQDEPVFQVGVGGVNVATANYHSTDTLGGNTKVYLVGERGVFTSNAVIVGNTSGAIFTCTGKFPGDLVLDSGKVLYVENCGPVSRGNNQSEVVKVVLQF